VACGSVLSNAPTYAQTLLTLLDALQPTGVTTLVLDQNNLSAALGAAAGINPVLAVQVLESSTFLSLATVISPVTSARPGTPILRLRVTYNQGMKPAWILSKVLWRRYPCRWASQHACVCSHSSGPMSAWRARSWWQHARGRWRPGCCDRRPRPAYAFLRISDGGVIYSKSGYGRLVVEAMTWNRSCNTCGAPDSQVRLFR
jgi:hypothetical protein